MPASPLSDWSWQPVFLDVDLDGYEDMIISHGLTHDVNDMDTIEKKDETAAGGRAGSAKTWVWMAGRWRDHPRNRKTRNFTK